MTTQNHNREVFKWLSKVIKWLRLLRVVIGLKDSRQFFNQWEAKPKPKPMAPCTRDFSRASSELQVIARNCDWFMALFIVFLSHLSVIDPVKPDPEDFFPSPTEKLVSSIFFYPASLWLPRCDFYIPSIFHLCMFEKGKTATWQKGESRWKICRPSVVFSKTRW